MQLRLISILFSVFLAGTLPGLVVAKTLFVAVKGINSSTCGAKDNPCRTIGQAIELAIDFDRIIVAPGLYGDVNGDGSLGAIGEELPRPGSGGLAMLYITKTLRIESRDGARVTILHGGGAVENVVEVRGDGSTFGGRNRGFTITGGSKAGLLVAGLGIRAEGHLAMENGEDGIFVRGNGNTLLHCQAVANGRHGIRESNGPNTLTENLSVGNALAGFELIGGGGELVRNSSLSNGSNGFRVAAGSYAFIGNVAHGNRACGFALSGDGSVLLRNSVIGNIGPGISTDSSILVTSNNIYGNDVLGGNCGLRNESGFLEGSQVDASKNFWGAPGGPGPDPADAVCDVGEGSQTTVSSNSRTEFKVKSRAGF